MGLRVTIHRDERDQAYVEIKTADIDRPLRVRVRGSTRGGDVELEFDGPHAFAIDRSRRPERQGNE